MKITSKPQHISEVNQIKDMENSKELPKVILKEIADEGDGGEHNCSNSESK